MRFRSMSDSRCNSRQEARRPRLRGRECSLGMTPPASSVECRVSSRDRYPRDIARTYQADSWDSPTTTDSRRRGFHVSRGSPRTWECPQSFRRRRDRVSCRSRRHHRGSCRNRRAEASRREGLLRCRRDSRGTQAHRGRSARSSPRWRRGILPRHPRGRSRSQRNSAVVRTRSRMRRRGRTRAKPPANGATRPASVNNRSSPRVSSCPRPRSSVRARAVPGRFGCYGRTARGTGGRIARPAVSLRGRAHPRRAPRPRRF